MTHPGRRPESDPLDHEKKLLLRFKDDPQEFDRIMLAHGEDIAGFLESLTHDPDLARELTQRTFVKAFSGLGTFDWRGISLASYLYRIARNELGRWAEESQVRKGADYLLDDLQAGPENCPEARAQRKSETALLEAFLERLEPQRRQVFDLFYWRELRIWEVARVLEISEAQVKADLRRGRDELKLAMQREGLDLRSFATLLDVEKGEMG